MDTHLSPAAVGSTPATVHPGDAHLAEVDGFHAPAIQLRHIHFSCATALIATDCAAFSLCLGMEEMFFPKNIHYMESVFFLSCAMLVVMLGYFAYQRHYTDRPPFWNEVAQIIAAAAMAGVAIVMLSWPDMQVASALFPFIMFPIVDVTLRQITKRVLHAMGLWRIPVLLAGEPEDCTRAIEIFSSERFPGLRSVGCIPPSRLLHMSGTHLHDMLLARHGAARLLLVMDTHEGDGRSVIEHVTRTRLPFSLMPPLRGVPLDHGDHAYFSHDAMIMTFRNNLDRPVHRAMKVALDLSVAMLVLMAILPILAVVYALVRLDGGPAVFGHMRIGRNGRPFRCLKFRTMAVNADAILADLLARDPQAAAEWAATRKLTSDPRITRVGRLLRRTSLDELPQIFNVLRLEMSLVGPRPIVMAEEVHYGVDMEYYMATRPGITGLWQVSGRSDTSYTRRVQLDNWYVRNWSLWRDIVILLKTIPAVLGQKGAR
ncbi:exopolysaccharide biosynthesis polyprenyl glycosylphosphotransferase [Gluconacetobacter entanii]|uniref:Exopolysaccharide biosynthesis polyprenyl glycosylphosphotransferase n=1 Tax=Gluconacetobacter entanii TaxID=108528 RepID=A0ABT3K7Y8_9PROT|nr:exopolysaccharide biosynthesis polyprenyl glycosylphosphotransferase [Gluconacetobacter entanii]MCE2578186.1 exopolysaccharide biosynthesis polyprenyl glycosylphosphotransferase [Komagataeibacter sp. FNDCR1]MBY4641051.1 exopolysaccharide biosynthesis polyprenyl glycosylphosphotransferase [Gluconacetobacter entanii]MCW4580247.1 exopolysaccharide biosynthesis polyprenyl glycosylphosphotransferase [Gluconacetobacter entanii]MCW4583582.1 exopolysaccharide biosynthesis polyprenyl glycosylphosphot